MLKNPSVFNLLICKYTSSAFYDWKYLNVLENVTENKTPSYASLQAGMIFHRLVPVWIKHGEVWSHVAKKFESRGQKNPQGWRREQLKMFQISLVKPCLPENAFAKYPACVLPPSTFYQPVSFSWLVGWLVWGVLLGWFFLWIWFVCFSGPRDKAIMHDN